MPGDAASQCGIGIGVLAAGRASGLAQTAGGVYMLLTGMFADSKYRGVHSRPAVRFPTR